mgnify:CR=1 FL=1
MSLILNGDTGISAVDGTASVPALVGVDTDTGVWFPATNTTAISTGGTERLRVDSSGNLCVGGTTQNTSTRPVFASNTAKAWVRFTGSSGTIASSYNVSSVTRNSTGYYTINFTTALANTNYAAVANSSASSSVQNNTFTFYNITGQVVATPTTSAFAVSVANGGSLTGIDPTYCSVSVFSS